MARITLKDAEGEGRFIVLFSMSMTIHGNAPDPD